MLINLKDKKYLLIPAVLSLIIAIYVTVTNNWPLSWDIYTHINYALAYMINGVTTVDPLLDAPHGKTIGYSPLFHMLLILCSYITQSDLVTSARLLQVILSVGAVLSVVYVSYKLFDEIASFAAGLLLISSFMFTRLLLPIPETLAIILFTLGIYLFYKSLADNEIWPAIISGILGLLILSVHFSTFMYYLGIITVLMIVQLLLNRSLSTIKNYLITLSPIIIVGLIAFVMLSMISSSFFNQMMTGALSILNNPLSLLTTQKAMGLERYIKCIGILPIVFGLIGFFYSFKDKEALFVSLWTLIAFVISNLHWIGIPVHTYRLLIYLVIPGVILGGYAFSKLSESLSSHNLGKILILVLIILSVFSVFVNITDSSALSSGVSTEYSTFTMAPPTNEDAELIDWFKNEQTNNKSILMNNLYTAMVISSVDVIPIHYQFDVYTNHSLTKSSLDSLNNENIGYIVYDKSLVINNSSDENLDVVYEDSGYYPLYYFTTEITSDNFDEIQLSGTEKVFENNKFIVCKVN